MRTFRILLGGWILGGTAIVLLSLGDVPEVVARPAPPAHALAIPQQQRSPILIPVRGIAANQLRDTFTQARGGGRSHGAMDILAPRGTEVVAAVDGKIRKIFTSKAGGLSVYQFDVKEERVYYYAHLDRYADGLREGQFVEQGTVLGYVGTTGNAPAGTPHLHFAIEALTAEKLWWKGTPLNPYPLLVR
jgi:murein DD-endopeptidase MepM/ murein hydrolase activator NlpD